MWTSDSRDPKTALRSTGAGRAVAPANEGVLCWDVKKGELLKRWLDPKCKSEVTVIEQSVQDPEVFAVGYGL